MKIKYVSILLLIILSPYLVCGKESVVPTDISSNPDFRLVSNFLIKYYELLHRNQTLETSDSLRRIKEDGFKYIIGNDIKLRNLSGKENFSIIFSNNEYDVTWSNEEKPVVNCVIPANIGLLTFANKIELEDSMIESLQNAATRSQYSASRPVESLDNLTKVTLSDYYVKDRGFYLTPRLRNQLVYSSISNGSAKNCSLLIDNDRYRLESIANVLLSGYTPFPLDVQVSVKQYGSKMQTINLPFPSLYEILSENNSTPYWGVETFDGVTVSGVYIWTNRYGGYNHLLSLSIPVSILSKPSTMTATLYCYIRTDNLKSLFEEYHNL